jgi:hypothetical protein
MFGIHHEHLALRGHGTRGGKAELAVRIPQFPENPFHDTLSGKNLDPVVSRVGDQYFIPEDANPLGPEEEPAFLPEPAEGFEKALGVEIEALNPAVVAVYDISGGSIYNDSLRPIKLTRGRADGKVSARVLSLSSFLQEAIASVFRDECDEEPAVRSPCRKLGRRKFQEGRGAVRPYSSEGPENRKTRDRECRCSFYALFEKKTPCNRE